MSTAAKLGKFGKPGLIALLVMTGSLIVGIGVVFAVREDSTDIAVGKTVEADGVAVTLERLQLKGTETAVLYTFESLFGAPLEPLGGPRMLLSDGTELRFKGGGTIPGKGELITATFPSLPPDTGRVSVKFGPYYSSTDNAAAIELDVGEAVRSIDRSSHQELQKIPVAQTFPVGEGQYQFAALMVRDVLDPTQATFDLVFEPRNEAAMRTPLLGASPHSQVKLSDDLGTTYVFLVGDKSFRPSDEFKLQREIFSFTGMPDPDATTFFLSISETGEIKKGPWTFEVDTSAYLSR